jgi:ubiquinone/menaquinone biosynthesis C-methylase UbiE
VTDIQVGDDEIETAIAPFVAREVPAGDAAWAAEETRLARKWRRLYRRRRWLGWLPRVRHDQANVKRVYDQTWTATDPGAKVAFARGDTPVEWRARRYLVGAQATKRVHVLYLMRVVAATGASDIVEVGCGNGVNLLLLADRFPEVRLRGFELTEAGVASAQAAIDAPALPPDLVAFSPEPLVGADAHRRVEVAVGSAAALPLPDGACDLAFTMLALEQMEQIRDAALAELARISRRHVLMIEPFADFNQTTLRRHSVQARDYFQGRVDQLGRYGLRPVLVSDNMPCKLGMGVGLVLAEKVN